MAKRKPADHRRPDPEFWFYPERYPELFLTPLRELPKRGQPRTDFQLFEIREWTFTREERERLRKWDKQATKRWNQILRKGVRLSDGTLHRVHAEGGQPKTPTKQMDRCRDLYILLVDALKQAEDSQVGKRTVEQDLAKWRKNLKIEPSESVVFFLRILFAEAIKAPGTNRDAARASELVWLLETFKGGVSLDQFRRNLKLPKKKTPAKP